MNGDNTQDRQQSEKHDTASPGRFDTDVIPVISCFSFFVFEIALTFIDLKNYSWIYSVIDAVVGAIAIKSLINWRKVK